jgi:hypothetical protein
MVPKMLRCIAARLSGPDKWTGAEAMQRSSFKRAKQLRDEIRDRFLVLGVDHSRIDRPIHKPSVSKDENHTGHPARATGLAGGKFAT